MREIVLVISIFVLSFVLGRITKKCPECEKCVNTVEIKKQIIIKEHEIEELHHQIEDIRVSNDRRKRDSLRAIYNPR